MRHDETLAIWRIAREHARRVRAAARVEQQRAVLLRAQASDALARSQSIIESSEAILASLPSRR